MLRRKGKCRRRRNFCKKNLLWNGQLTSLLFFKENLSHIIGTYCFLNCRKLSCNTYFVTMQYPRTPIIAAVLSGGDSQRIFFLPLLGGWCWCHWLVVKSHFFFPSRHQPANPSSPQLFLSSGMRRGRLACNFHLPLFSPPPTFRRRFILPFLPASYLFSGDSNFGGIGWAWEKDAETDTFLQQSNPFLWARKIAPPTAIAAAGGKTRDSFLLFRSRDHSFHSLPEFLAIDCATELEKSISVFSQS